VGEVGSRKTLKRVGTIKYVFKFLFMKRIKIAMAALVVTAGLVASFAFTHKPAAVDYIYGASKKSVNPGNTSEFIVSSELTELWAGVPKYWSIGTETQGTSEYLNYIEFDNSQLSLSQAIGEVKTYFDAAHTPRLPMNATFVTTINGYTIKVVRE
jgi:hypothetical protein